MGGEIPPFNPCLLIMVGSILKTIGICLTSLGSFNIPKQTRNEETGRIEYDLTWNRTESSSQRTWRSTAYAKYTQTMYEYNEVNTTNGSLKFATYTSTVYSQSTLWKGSAIPGDTTPGTFIQIYVEIENPINVIKYEELQEIYYTCSNNYGITDTEWTFNIYKTNLNITDELNGNVDYDTYQGYIGQTLYIQNIKDEITNTTLISGDLECYVNSGSGDPYIYIDSQADLEAIYNKNTKLILTIELNNNEIVVNPAGLNTYYSLGFIKHIEVYCSILYTEGLNMEVIDLPGLMFDVLTMPFTFWSRAFNLTLFAGTPYQLNVSMLLLSLLAIALFIFIMKKFLLK